MAEFGKTEKFTAPEKENPFIEPLTAIVADGIDTLFPVTFDADKYTAEKLLIQDAARRLGYSARVHESDFEDGSNRRKVVTTFRIRPARKGRGASDEVVEEAPETVAE